MFNPGDVIHAQVTKGDVKQEAGLVLECHHGRYYVRKVKGLFKRRNVPVQPGDQLLKLNGRDVEDYRNLQEMKDLIKDEMKIMIVFMRTDPEDSSDSTASGYNEPEVYEEIEYPNDHSQNNNNTNYAALEYQSIRPGDIMMLDGLKAKPELNGEIVKVLEEAQTPGRWQVEVRSSKAVLSAKSENLVPVSYDNDDEEEEEVLQLENGRAQQQQQEDLLQLGYAVQPGMTMKLYKLKKKAKLNGTRVKVLREASKPGRWDVEMVDTKQVMSIAEENLKPV